MIALDLLACVSSIDLFLVAAQTRSSFSRKPFCRRDLKSVLKRNHCSAGTSARTAVETTLPTTSALPSGAVSGWWPEPASHTPLYGRYGLEPPLSTTAQPCDPHADGSSFEATDSSEKLISLASPDIKQNLP
jgi:hypothetical protein